MARIKDEDVALVRERARIEDVVGEAVALKNAGGGSYKGLCPFHDERSPSFHVTPAKGLFYCFGCQEGGDAIAFVQKTEMVTFAEAVEKLAAKCNVTLRYEEGTAAPSRQQGQRTRLIAAHKEAGEFYARALGADEASVARGFLAERGFEQEAASLFGLGYAPKGWDSLTNHMRSRGFTDAELMTSGLAVQGKRGPYDRFRGRLLWPIRDVSGDTIGFGARKLYEDDEGPKYLNTPETPIYRKSQVLYGIDLARKDIAKNQQAVIVEGYTDVMAAHLAGVTTAVATCGTAFGSEHVKVLRRLLMDREEMRGEVVFTFDGDAAGQRAAMKAYQEDQRFVANTFVAIEANGLDPCEVRQQRGDDAVRELIAQRIPLFEFVIRTTLNDFNLDTAEGRVAGLRAAAPIVAGIKDPSLRPEYTRMLSGWVGLEPDVVARAVKGSTRGQEPRRQVRDSASDVVSDLERESLKVVLQRPSLITEWWAAVELEAFTVDTHRSVYRAVATAGVGAAGDERAWAELVLASCEDDEQRNLVLALSVEPWKIVPPTNPEPGSDPVGRYAESVIARLLELDAGRRLAEIKARLQRADPEAEQYQQLFAELLGLEKYRRELRDTLAGE